MSAETIAQLVAYGPLNLSTRVERVFPTLEDAWKYRNKGDQHVHIAILAGAFKRGADVPVDVKRRGIDV